ncbi:MAG: DUF3644 domain-containing protein [Spirochaetia bacterium]|nr:DUF3644 domain-containing protein [Spirochaetia bacterium]
MIVIRQGKTKNILENSRNSALSAVEIYNRPNSSFRLESYIVLMIIAWTKLFHAYFQATQGEKYFYKEKNGRYKKVDGEKKAWELSTCIKQFKKILPKGVQLSEAACCNLEFFIGLRNKIEHRYWSGSEFDVLLFGECQALLFNYESLLVALFGADYSINTCLAFALQFSHMRAGDQITSQRVLLSNDMKDIKRYIDKYRAELSQEIFDSQEYSIKLLQIPKVSNTNRTDLAVEFVNWNSLDENDKENYNKIVSIIKDKLVIKNVSNANLLRPSDVVNQLKEKMGIDIGTYNHAKLWKAFKVRPGRDADDKFETKDRYCVYDEPHNDYLYTSEWVKFVIGLFQKYGFTKENMGDKCIEALEINDYC